MNDVDRLLVDIHIAIALEASTKPHEEVVVYMTDECRDLIMSSIVGVIADRMWKPTTVDTIFGCVARRMVADGIRFAVAHERVFERSKTDE